MQLRWVRASRRPWRCEWRCGTGEGFLYEEEDTEGTYAGGGQVCSCRSKVGLKALQASQVARGRCGEEKVCVCC